MCIYTYIHRTRVIATTRLIDAVARVCACARARGDRTGCVATLRCNNNIECYDEVKTVKGAIYTTRYFHRSTNGTRIRSKRRNVLCVCSCAQCEVIFLRVHAKLECL